VKMILKMKMSLSPVEREGEGGSRERWWREKRSVKLGRVKRIQLCGKDILRCSVEKQS
jgi:hypothetical protein